MPFNTSSSSLKLVRLFFTEPNKARLWDHLPGPDEFKRRFLNSGHASAVLEYNVVNTDGTITKEVHVFGHFSSKDKITITNKDGIDEVHESIFISNGGWKSDDPMYSKAPQYFFVEYMRFVKI
jgi:hypothetical protein